jgi:hypothetical protein
LRYVAPQQRFQVVMIRVCHLGYVPARVKHVEFLIYGRSCIFFARIHASFRLQYVDVSAVVKHIFCAGLPELHVFIQRQPETKREHDAEPFFQHGIGVDLVVLHFRQVMVVVAVNDEMNLILPNAREQFVEKNGILPYAVYIQIHFVLSIRHCDAYFYFIGGIVLHSYETTKI